MSNDFVMARYEDMVKAKKHLPFQMGYLTESMVTKAMEELGETDEVKAKTIHELRNMLDSK